MGTGHFTQVVWHNTTHVGMARDTTDTGSFIFCNYGPAGNYMGRFDQNVKPLGTQSTEHTDKAALPPKKAKPVTYRSVKTVVPKATPAEGEPSDLEKRKQQRMQREKKQQETKDREKMRKLMVKQHAKEKEMPWDEEASTTEELTASMAAITCMFGPWTQVEINTALRPDWKGLVRTRTFMGKRPHQQTNSKGVQVTVLEDATVYQMELTSAGRYRQGMFEVVRYA